MGLTAGPDATLYFTEQENNKIAKITNLMGGGNVAPGLKPVAPGGTPTPCTNDTDCVGSGQACGGDVCSNTTHTCVLANTRDPGRARRWPIAGARTMAPRASPSRTPARSRPLAARRHCSPTVERVTEGARFPDIRRRSTRRRCKGATMMEMRPWFPAAIAIVTLFAACGGSDRSVTTMGGHAGSSPADADRGPFDASGNGGGPSADDERLDVSAMPGADATSKIDERAGAETGSPADAGSSSDEDASSVDRDAGVDGTAGPPKAGLVLYLRLDDDPATSALDEVTSTKGAASMCVSVPGKVGRGFHFNGSTSLIRFPDRAEYDVTSAITVAAWIRPHTGDLGGGPRILEKGYTPTDQDTQYRFYIAGKTIAFALFDQGRTAAFSAPLPPLDEWHHVAVTWDGGTGAARVYVDAVVKGTATYRGAIGTTAMPIYVGSKHEMDPVTNWDGDLDEVALYSRALAQDEILALFRQ